jgi:hypothetical protein
LQSIQEVLTAISSIQDTIGGKSAGFDWKAIAGEAGLRLIDKLGPALPAMLMPTPAMQPNPARHMPAAPPPGQAATQAPAQAVAQASAQANQQAPTEEENTQMMAMYRQLLMNIAPAMMTKMNNGAPGSEFADWFIEGYGRMVYEQVKAAGKETIIGAFRSIPELWAQLAPVENTFTTFIEEFLAWTPEEYEDPPAPPPPPVEEIRTPKPGKGKKAIQ